MGRFFGRALREKWAPTTGPRQRLPDGVSDRKNGLRSKLALLRWTAISFGKKFHAPPDGFSRVHHALSACRPARRLHASTTSLRCMMVHFHRRPATHTHPRHGRGRGSSKVRLTIGLTWQRQPGPSRRPRPAEFLYGWITGGRQQPRIGHFSFTCFFSCIQMYSRVSDASLSSPR